MEHPDTVLGVACFDVKSIAKGCRHYTHTGANDITMSNNRFMNSWVTSTFSTHMFFPTSQVYALAPETVEIPTPQVLEETAWEPPLMVNNRNKRRIDLTDEDI